MSSSVFERLVQDLSSDERKEMIQKLTQQTSISDAPLMDMESDVVEMDWERGLESFGFFKRIWIYIKTFFSGYQLKDMVEKQMLGDLARSIEKCLPGMVNFNVGYFGGGFYEELAQLVSALRFFRGPLDRAMGDEKGEFFAFLVGRELPLLQSRLIEESNHWDIYLQNKERTNKDIKNIAEANLRLALDDIPPTARETLYHYVKVLTSWKRLCDVNDKKLLAPFESGSTSPETGNATDREMKAPLFDLWERLSNLVASPPKSLIETIFLFQTEEMVGENSKEFPIQFEKLIKKAALSMEAIRRFNNTIPLGKIAKYLSQNLSLMPRIYGGAENWFNIYRQFWAEKIEREFRAFSYKRNRQQADSETLKFLNITEQAFKRISPIPSLYRADLTKKYTKPFALIEAFMERIFAVKVNPLLKKILMEGEFYKKANRQSFSDCYNFLLKWNKKVADFRSKFGEEAKWGQSLAQVKTLTDPVQREKNYDVMSEEIEVEVINLVDEARRYFNLLFDVWGGIVRGEGGAFDTLSNIGQISGKNNAHFLRELEKEHRKWGRFINLLRDLCELEISSPELP
jgi:hypothetical protein